MIRNYYKYYSKLVLNQMLKIRVNKPQRLGIHQWLLTEQCKPVAPQNSCIIFTIIGADSCCAYFTVKLIYVGCDINSPWRVHLQSNVHYCRSLRGYAETVYHGNLMDISRMEIRACLMHILNCMSVGWGVGVGWGGGVISLRDPLSQKCFESKCSYKQL